MAEIIVLNDQEVSELVSFDENLRLIEQAFADYSMGKSHAYPVIREKIEQHGGIFGIKSGYIETQRSARVSKQADFGPATKRRGCPTTSRLS